MIINLKWRACYTWTLIVIVLLIAIGSVSYIYGIKRGITLGLTGYHNQCLIGGIIINEEGAAIKCGPVGQIPKEEIKNLTL